MRIPLDHIQHGACHASMYAACKSPHPPRLLSINPLQVSVYDVALVNEAHAPGRILKHLKKGELSSGQKEEGGEGAGSFTHSRMHATQASLHLGS